MRKQSSKTAKKIDESRAEEKAPTIREELGLTAKDDASFEDTPAEAPDSPVEALVAEGTAQEPEVPEKPLKDADAKKEGVVFEELGSNPYLLHQEYVKYAVQRVGSKGCDLIVAPGMAEEAARIANMHAGIEHVVIDPRLPFQTWFVRKGQNAIGSRGV